MPPQLDVENIPLTAMPDTHQRSAAKTTWVSIVVNLLLTFVQVSVGCISASQSLIADGIHSLSDLLSDGVVLWANQHSRKAPDEDHHYGHHRYETAASLILGILLLIVGIGLANSAILNLSHPNTSTPSQGGLYLALGTATLTLLAKEGLFRYMLKEATRLRSTLLIANAWHARSDAASSLVVTLGITGKILGYPLLDPIAALIVGGMIGKMGWSFAWEALHDLMDRSVEQHSLQHISDTLLNTQGVKGIHHLRTRKVGDFIWVDVHLEVDGTLSVTEGHHIAVSAKTELMNEIPTVLNVMIHIDPA